VAIWDRRRSAAQWWRWQPGAPSPARPRAPCPMRWLLPGAGGAGGQELHNRCGFELPPRHGGSSPVRRVLLFSMARASSSNRDGSTSSSNHGDLTSSSNRSGPTS
jgi:hypothetical protein